MEGNVTALARLHVAAKQVLDGRRFDNVETDRTAECAGLPIMRTGNGIGHHSLDGVRSANVDHREGRDGRVGFFQQHARVEFQRVNVSVKFVQLAGEIDVAARQFHETRVLWHAEKLPVIVETLQTQLTALADHVFELVQQHWPVILMSQLFFYKLKHLY